MPREKQNSSLTTAEKQD